jgi:hypothetical protein
MQQNKSRKKGIETLSHVMNVKMGGGGLQYLFYSTVHATHSTVA